MDRLLTTDNLEQHTQHHKSLNIKRDFVQEYLDALLPWEHVPGTPFVDQSELEARVKEQPLQSPSSKQKHNSSNHRHSQHHNTHTPQDHKRQSSASHHQQPLNSHVKEQNTETNEPTGSKRLKSEVSPIVTPKTDMKQPLPNTGAKSVDQKDDSPKTRRKKETKREKQEEQKSKRRRKQASQNDTELDVVAHEIRQLDVKSNIKKPATNGRQNDMAHEGPITRSRSAVQGHKSLRTHKSVATLKPPEAGPRHLSPRLEDRLAPLRRPYIDSGQITHNQHETTRLLAIQQLHFRDNSDYKRLLCETTKAYKEQSLSDSESSNDKIETSSFVSNEHRGRYRIKDPSKSRKILASSSLLMNQFSAPGIANNRITLLEQKNDRLGIFKKGKASTKAAVPHEFSESVFLGRTSSSSDNTLQETEYKERNPSALSAEQTTSIFFRNSQAQQPQQNHCDAQMTTRQKAGFHVNFETSETLVSVQNQPSNASNESFSCHVSHASAASTKQVSPTAQTKAQCSMSSQGMDVHFRQTTPEDVVDELLDELQERVHLTTEEIPVYSTELPQTACRTQTLSSTLPYTMHPPLSLPFAHVSQDGPFGQPLVQPTPMFHVEYQWNQQGSAPFDSDGGPIAMLSPLLREEQPVLVPLYAEHPWISEPTAMNGAVYCQQEPAMQALGIQPYQQYTPLAPIPTAPCSRDTMSYDDLSAHTAASIRPSETTKYAPGYAIPFGGFHEWRMPY